MKTKILLLITFLLTCGVSLFAQPMVHLTRFEGQRITGVKASNMFKVELRQGDQTGVQIEINEEAMPQLTCELNDGILRIGMHKSFDKNFFKAQKNLSLKAVVTLNRLDYLSLSDMTSAWGEGIFTADGNAEITVSDMSKINQLELQAARIDVRCSDMSKISGTTLRSRENVSLDVSDMSSASNVTIYASRLDVSVSDMSKVSVGGEVNSLGKISSNDMSKLNHAQLTVKNR